MADLPLHAHRRTKRWESHIWHQRQQRYLGGLQHGGACRQGARHHGPQMPRPPRQPQLPADHLRQPVGLHGQHHPGTPHTLSAPKPQPCPCYSDFPYCISIKADTIARCPHCASLEALLIGCSSFIIFMRRCGADLKRAWQDEVVAALRHQNKSLLKPNKSGQDGSAESSPSQTSNPSQVCYHTLAPAQVCGLR